MNVKRFPSGLALLGVAALALAGCGSSAPSSSTGPKSVYFIFNGYTPPYFAPMAQGIQDVAAHYPDLNIKVVSANGSSSSEISDINAAVAAGAQGIILNAVDTSVTSAAKQAVAQGIPIVTLDRDVSDPSARFAFIGDNDVKLGQQEATACLQAGAAQNLPTPYHVVVLQGTQGATTAVDRVKGSMDVLQSAIAQGAVQVVLNQAADFDTGAAQSLMSEYLTKSPNIQMVLAGNDAMALGAINALKSAGIAPGTKTVVCGLDAQPESLAAIQAGTQAVTGTHAPLLEAFWAVEAMDNYLRNHTTPPSSDANGVVLIPQTVVTKANVGQVTAWGTPITVPPLPYGTASAYPS
jgi:ABC-type sugar transport system substrate-binding protein